MAVTTDGELKDLQTGATVTYPELFGAAITQPNPLAKAKEDGVEGAIIRLGYGWNNSIDKTAIRNIITFQDPQPLVPEKLRTLVGGQSLA